LQTHHQLPNLLSKAQLVDSICPLLKAFIVT
jgi:hypothetical protein